MTKIAKRALGLTSALFFVGALALVASPVQAVDADSRIGALERELALLKQSQEAADESRALAAASKMPKFKYKAGKGLTIAGADNNWSIKFTQRLQVLSTFWVTDENVDNGLQHGQIRIRRFRPAINVTSQQGFYAVNWMFSGKDSAAFNGDGYINFNKINPYLPSLGYGYNPSIKGLSEGAYRPEDSLLSNALGFAGSQDRSIVLAWNKLPSMGLSKIAFVNLAMGHDEMDEYGADPGVTDDNRSFLATVGVKPLGGSKGMGGLSMKSLQYTFAYESLRNGYAEGRSTIAMTNCTECLDLVDMGTATGDHTFYGHGITWSPTKFLDVAFHHITWTGDADSGASADMEATEWRAAARVWLWGPKSGALGGGRVEGGVSIAPMISTADLKKTAGGDTGDLTNTGIAVDYYVPGGWLKLSGIWDNYDCDTDICHTDVTTVATTGKEDFNTFTVYAEYRF
jgi:hypothetical protein